MFIKKIQMKDYKRFHDLTIDLGKDPKRIIALVGPNGCGKSSVFDAMLYWNRGKNQQIGQYNLKDFHYHSLHQNREYNYYNNCINIEFVEGNNQEIIQNLKEEGKENTIFSFRSSFRYNSNLNVKQAIAVDDILKNREGASSASDMDQRTETDYRRLLAKYNNIMNEKDLKPSEAKQLVISELNNAIEKCLDLQISSIGNIESNKGTLYFKKKDSDIEFEYNVLSAGEKEVVDILLDLYLRKDFYNNSVYIIDEPELHLNIAIQRNLINEINKMIPQNCQIWVATHSIGFLRALQNELKEISQVVYFRPENKWASETYTLSTKKLSRVEWKEIFSTALDDLSELICPKTIIYCEGKALPNRDKSEAGLDAYVYNEIFSKKYPDTMFVSSGGNTELDQRSEIAMSILTKAISRLEILVLKDRDMASGKITDENDRKQYLKNNHDNHRVLKRLEIENYLYDKEVLKAYCKQENLEFNEEKYNKLVHNINNDNLKDSTGEIKNCCGIKGSINPEKFKKNLATYITDNMDVYKELEDVIFKNNF